MAKRNKSANDGPGALPKRRETVIEEQSLAEATRTRYLNYALSVITSRALPDVRDGLKPVQRRILYAMFTDLRLTSDSRFMKCASVVGEVIGNYHPHGDQSIYDALVRMAQPFSLRQPLVEGYGNFGSIDGDPPAAFRYTECRLTPIAAELLNEIRSETVEFRPNFASTREEPTVLPAQFPNLLVNGVTGIAVGMATNIPPHNLKEVCSALVALLDDRELPLEKIVKFIVGPDFPTAGVILNSAEEIKQVYAIGQGSIRVRGTYAPDSEKPNRVNITSIPFGIEKDPLVQRIGELIAKGQVPQLVNVKDLSTEEIRIELELRPGANLEAAMAYLFKNTPLQTNFNVNMTCLLPTTGTDAAVPARLDLKSILQHFLDFRLEVVTRRLTYELNHLLARIHILQGFAIVFNNLDEAIRIIRDSDGKPDAAPKLMARFELSDLQADAILETKLYRLGKLEINDILDELAKKRERADQIQGLLDHEPSLWNMIRAEIKAIASAYGEPRRTAIQGPSAPVEFREEDYIIDEDAWVIVTRDGWTKRQKSFNDVGSIRIRDDDQVRWIYRSKARHTLTLFTNRGMAYTLRANDIPLTTGHGEPIQKLFAFEDNERIVSVLCHDPRCLPDVSRLAVETMPESQPVLNGEVGRANAETNGSSLPPPPYFLAMTAAGKVLRFPLAALVTVSTKKGRVVVRLDSAFDNDEVVGVELSEGTEKVCLATRSARVLIFLVTEANIVSSAAKGVTGIKLDSKDRVLGFALADKMREGFEVKTNRGTTVVVRATKYPVTSRGGKGYGVLQRGHLEAILHEEATPIPPLEDINES